jgi:hypothetical protein
MTDDERLECWNILIVTFGEHTKNLLFDDDHLVRAVSYAKKIQQENIKRKLDCNLESIK